ncbi:MAG: alkaline phosphatase family protein [Caldilineaceae bacterium]
MEVLNIEFKPEAGQVEIWGYRFGDDDPPPISLMLNDGKGPPLTFEEMVAEAIAGDNFGDNLPPSVIPGGVLIEVFEPGASLPKHRLETKDFTNDLDLDFHIRNKLNCLTFTVPAILAKRKWLCRITNFSPIRSLCTGKITFPWVSVEIEETRISRRLFNRVFAELLKALGLQIYANPWIGLVAIDEETAERAHLTDGIISQVDTEELGQRFMDIKNFTLTNGYPKIEAGINGSSPQLRITSEFGADINIGKWEIFGVDIIKGLEINKVTININVDLFISSDLVGVIGRTLMPMFDVKVIIEGKEGNILLPAKVDQFCNAKPSFSNLFNLNDVEKLIECVFRRYFTYQEAREAIALYLTQGFRELTQRNHFLWNIRADAESYIVHHFGLPISTLFPTPTEEFEGGGNEVELSPPLLPPVSPPAEGFEGGNNDITGGFAIGAGLGSNTRLSFLNNLEAIVADAGLAGITEDEDVDPSPEDGPNNVPTNLDKIEHIVVLMMENRSFDHMLGYLFLHGGRKDIDGLTGNESIIKPGGATDGQGNPILIHPFPITTSFFKYSPFHDFENVRSQINEGKMDGFVENFLKRFDTKSPEWVMSYYKEDVLTTYDKLASTFAVCDHWFAAHPGPKGFGRRVKRVNHLGELLQRDTPLLNPPIIELPPKSESELIDESKGMKEKESTANDFHDVLQRFALPNFPDNFK